MPGYDHFSVIDPSSIRLVELEGWTDANELIVTSETHKVADGPDYDAISYTWGADDEKFSIAINGAKYAVSSNLYDLLQFLYSDQQSKNGRRRLWIDAICINQKNLLEKSSQLGLMKDIYSKARTVVVWLGPSDETTALAFETLEHFATQNEPTFSESGAPSSAKERKAAILELARRPYFNRVWIVQEVVVAQRAVVRCGKSSMSFDRFGQALRRLTSTGFLPWSVSDVGKVSYLYFWRQRHQQLCPAENNNADFGLRLIVDARDKSASDPRDKIYGLLGLFDEEVKNGISVDYIHNVKRVYTDFARHMLTAEPGLRILSAVSLQHRREATFVLPSWVPDWTQGQLGGGLMQKFVRFSPSMLFSAGGGVECRVKTDLADLETICVEGVRLGTVQGIIHIKDLLSHVRTKPNQMTASSIKHIASKTMPGEVYPFTDEPNWEAFFRTMTAERSPLSTRIDNTYRKDHFSVYSQWAVPGQHNIQTLTENDWSMMSRLIDQVLEDKIMFMTEEGHLGLGQEGLQPGDGLCIFIGGEIPFSLRELPHKPSRYQLLSECYVHGFMDGEIMLNLEDKNIEGFLIE